MAGVRVCDHAGMNQRKKTSEKTALALPEGKSLMDLKREGQARDLERQRRGELTGAEIGAGMAAVVKRCKILKYT